MESSCRVRFLKCCRRYPEPRAFLERCGAGVDAVAEEGENLLTWLLLTSRSGRRRLVPWALMLGWPADVVGDGAYPCCHSPLYEACDDEMWEEARLMLARPLRREALESALYWACYAWDESPLALSVLQELIAQLGGFYPATLPQLMELLVMGGVYPLIPGALAAGYLLPEAGSAWWHEEGWSSADRRGDAAWQSALMRFAAAPLPLRRRLSDVAPRQTRKDKTKFCGHLPKLPRRLKKKARFERCEREWLWLLRACCDGE